jgi:hypothetical protein
VKRPTRPASKSETHVLVPIDALDELLEAIWEWAFADYRATPPVDRKDHLFHNIVHLDSALHGLTVDESWSRIEAWRNGQQPE